MDMFDFDNVRTKKSSAILQYNNLKTIQSLFRVIELCVGIILVSWTSSRLPFAVKASGEYFRVLISVIVSPLFIFFISNVIVLTLLFKSGHLSSHSPISIITTTEENNDLYQDFIERSSGDNPTVNYGEKMQCSPSAADDEKIVEIVYEDKEMVYEEDNNNIGAGPVLVPYHRDVLESRNENSVTKKMYRRSKSERLQRETSSDSSREEEEKSNKSGKLRRWETEKHRRKEEEGYVFDELSNEEFQKTIEAFIAKQLKFHKEEKLAIVLHNSNQA